MSDKEYLLVRSSALPDVFRKTIEVKRLLDSEKCRSINRAVQEVGLSRSAYYKYVKAVRVFEETRHGEMFRLLVGVENFSGVLPRLVEAIAEAGCRLVSLHQDMAIKGVSYVLLTLDSQDEGESRRPDELAAELSDLQGVTRVQRLD